MTSEQTEALPRDPRALEQLARASKSEAEALALWKRAAELWSENAAVDPLAQAGLIRCLRRIGTDSVRLRAEVERGLVRFESSEIVRSEAVFVLAGEARRQAEAGALEAAAISLFDAMACLGDPSRSTYGANSVLAAMRAIKAALTDRRADLRDAAPALEQVLTALRQHGARWCDALSDTPEGRGAGHGRAPSSRLQALYLVRKLVRQGEDWQLLASMMTRAIDGGVDDPFVTDSAAEALVALDRAQDALALLRERLRQRPDCDVLIRREAGIWAGMGRDDRAAEILEPAALAADSPWIWRDLADLRLRLGLREEVREALRCGLALHDPREAGMVWRLHFQLAELAFEAGDEPDAVREVFLAREARENAGWGCGHELDDFIRRHDAWLGEGLRELASRPRGDLRREATKGYRRVRRARLVHEARETDVLTARSGFAFLRHPSGGPNVFVPPHLLKQQPLDLGDRVRVVIAPSFDRKKQKEGFRAVWLDKVGSGA